jgi:hypothetical protein
MAKVPAGMAATSAGSGVVAAEARAVSATARPSRAPQAAMVVIAIIVINDAMMLDVWRNAVFDIQRIISIL